jgi:hypothetical protein
MITLSQAAKLCQLSYVGNVADWDSWIDTGNVAAGVKIIEGEKVIAFRGSKVLEDFIHDIGGVDPVYVDNIGTVGAGFYAGVEPFFKLLDLQAGESITLTGHSLGTSHAAYVARLAILSGVKVSYMALFAPPRAGYVDFYRGLEAVGKIDALHNEFDPVPDVPLTLPYMPFVPFRNIQTVRVSPDTMLDRLDPIAYHSIGLYARACDGLSTMP